MAEDGKQKEKTKTTQGGFRTMPFILANDACDRFAMTGFNANLITYLTQQLHMPLVQAANTLTNLNGTSNFTPIIGGLIADSFAGRFWTITGGTIIYLLGMITMTVISFLSMFRLPPCSGGNQTCRGATWRQLLVIYMSLLLTSVGAGGIRSCVVPFGADQFGDRAESKKNRFFNLYFICVTLATAMALTVVVYIQDNVGWGWGLGVPTMAMLASLVVFAAGYPLYVKKQPGGSPLTRLAQVVAGAIRKRKMVGPLDPRQLYSDAEVDAGIATNGRLLHTERLRFLDRAAIISAGDTLDSGEPKPWRLSTVHRVEELKAIIRILPIWSVGIFFAASGANNRSFSIQQARTMDRHLSSNFQIPPATMSIFSDIAAALTLIFYTQIFVPIARCLTGLSTGITCLQRIGIGLAITILCNVSAAVVEAKRRAAAAEHGLLDNSKAVVPMSVFWMVPQHAIHGIGEAFMSVGQMEFLYDQAPESMRSTAAAMYWLAISLGNYTGTVLVTVVKDVTSSRGEWLQDNINRGRLDHYYWVVVALQVVNLVYFISCAMVYRSKRVEVRDEGDRGEREELVSMEGRRKEAELEGFGRLVE